MAVTPSAPRPAMRPATQQQKPKQSSGLLIGLIGAGVLAAAGLSGAGFLYSKQGGLTAEIGTHQTALLSAATSLGIAVDTNTPVVWGELWSKLTASITAMKNEAERQTARINEMTQELEAAAGLQATLTRVQGDAQRAAQQVNELRAQIETLQRNSAAQIGALQAQLAEAKQAAEQAAAELSSVKSSQAQIQPEAAAPAVDPAPQPSAPSEPVARPAAASAPAKGAAAEPAPAIEVANPGAPAMFSFPPRSEVLATAQYDGTRQTLAITLRDGTVLNYTDFPQEVYERLIAAGSADTFFRMRVVGNYPVTPDDKAAVRGLRR